jgi:hypothetical protein
MARENRIIRRVIVFALLGAIINVAVAWGFATAWKGDDFKRVVSVSRLSGSGGGGFRMAAGFPLRAFQGERWSWWRWDSFQQTMIGGVSRNTFWKVDSLELRDKDELLLPYRPIWPGFATNTLFYAAILWLIFAVPGRVRRRRRIRRGVCPACAYPVGASVVHRVRRGDPCSGWASRHKDRCEREMLSILCGSRT